MRETLVRERAYIHDDEYYYVPELTQEDINKYVEEHYDENYWFD